MKIRTEHPTAFKFRKTPTIADAIVYILYEADYHAMKADGISIPPPEKASSNTFHGTCLATAHRDID